MTPEQKLKKEIVLLALKDKNIEIVGGIDTSNVEEIYQQLVDSDLHWDYKNEIRQGQVETDLDCEYSRHYESKAVAMQVEDGSWVGWTYWYGGGKFGEPESIDFMANAYDLDYEEEEKVVVVRTFKKK